MSLCLGRSRVATTTTTTTKPNFGGFSHLGSVNVYRLYHLPESMLLHIIRTFAMRWPDRKILYQLLPMHLCSTYAQKNKQEAKKLKRKKW